MPLIDMKLSKSGKKRLMDYPCTVGKKAKGPEYPWGLDINLETEQIKKLGLNLKTLKRGDELPVQAVLKVRNKSEHEGEDYDGVQLSLGLRMIKIAIDKGKK